MTWAGEHVRSIGVGVIDGAMYAVTANPQLVAVGAMTGTEQIFLFDLGSGDLVRSMGTIGGGVGSLYGVRGLRFTPDGAHILVAEYNNDRLSLFTLTGEFVSCIGFDVLRWPSDVDFAPNGDILVASQGGHRICVFSSDGSNLLRTFGYVEETEESIFRAPTALAVQATNCTCWSKTAPACRCSSDPARTRIRPFFIIRLPLPPFFKRCQTMGPLHLCTPQTV